MITIIANPHCQGHNFMAVDSCLPRIIVSHWSSHGKLPFVECLPCARYTVNIILWNHYNWQSSKCQLLGSEWEVELGLCPALPCSISYAGCYCCALHLSLSHFHCRRFLEIFYHFPLQCLGFVGTNIGQMRMVKQATHFLLAFLKHLLGYVRQDQLFLETLRRMWSENSAWKLLGKFSASVF